MLMSPITWQRGGRGLGAGGAEELDVRGMEPASLPLLASSLEGQMEEIYKVMNGLCWAEFLD